MSYSNPRKYRIAKALLASTALCAGLSVPAYAQTEPASPVRQAVDSNGIDLFLGVPNIGTPGISLGGNQGLAFNWLWQGAGWQQSFNVSMYKSGSIVTVDLGGKADMFTISGSTYVPTEGSGSSLSLSGTIYTYRLSDGTVIHFDKSTTSGTNYEARAIDIVEPSGKILSFKYDQDQYCANAKPSGDGYICLQYATAKRLGGVTSNYGYSLGLEYQNDDLADIPPDFAGWYSLVGVSGSNLASGSTSPIQSMGASITASGGLSYFSVTDPLSRTTTYRSNGPQLLGIKLPSSASEDVTYNYSSGRVSNIATPAGSVSYTSSDAAGVRTVTVTDALSHSTVYKFDIASKRMTSLTNAAGQTTNWQYDGSGRITRVSNPEGDYTQLTYDARGNVTETRHVAKSGSGLADIVTSASYPASCSNVVTCNSPTSTTDARGNVTDYAYDGTTGLITTVTAPAATTGGTRPQTRYSYAAHQAYYDKGVGIVASGTPVTLPTGTSTCATGSSCTGSAAETVTSISYGPQTSGVGNNLLPVSVTAAAGDGSISTTAAYTYDATGNVSSVDGPLAGTADAISYRYDAARQRLGEIAPDPDGGGALKRKAVRTGYNAHGQVTTSELGTVDGTTDTDWAAFNTLEQSEIGYDAAGRPVKAETKAGGTTYTVSQTSYDAAGRVECVAQRMNPAVFSSLPSSACTMGTAGSGSNDFGPDRIVKNVYDATGRVTKVQTAVGTAEQSDEVTTAYTNNGQTDYVIDAENNRTEYSYDGHDRLVKTEYPSTTKGANAANASDYEQLGYDANGSVTSRRLRDGQTITYGYDNLNRLISKDIPNAAYFDYDINYQYDLLGRLTQAETGPGHVNSFIYDALGRTTVKQMYNTTTSSSYDAAGRRTRMTWGDGNYVTYDYNLTGNVTAIRENGASSGIGVLATYAYDNLGRRVSLTRGNGTVTSYAYDPVSRLSSLSEDIAGTTYDQTATLTHNPANQIDLLSKSNDLYAWFGHYNVDRVSAGNGLNQLVAATPVGGQVSVPVLGYDAKGNLTSSGGDSYSYTVANRMATAPGNIRLGYEPAGGQLLQVYDVATGADLRFGWDGDRMNSEFSAHAGMAMTRRYVPGPGVDETLVWYEGAGLADRRWLHSDERGSVTAITDGSGNVININRYDEYGIPASTNIGRFQYTGQAWLPELNLYYYKARIYNPALGRFMQTDPIGYADGMNWYNYVGSDPVNMIDPSGTGMFDKWQWNCYGNCMEGSGYWNTGIAGLGTPVQQLAAAGWTHGAAGWIPPAAKGPTSTGCAPAAGSEIAVCGAVRGKSSVATRSLLAGFASEECATLISPCARYYPIDLAYRHIADTHFGDYDTANRKSVFAEYFQSAGAMRSLYRYATRAAVPVPYGKTPGAVSLTVALPRIVGKNRDGTPTYYLTFTLFSTGFDSDGLPIYTPSNAFPGLPSK